MTRTAEAAPPNGPSGDSLSVDISKEPLKNDPPLSPKRRQPGRSLATQRHDQRQARPCPECRFERRFTPTREHYRGGDRAGPARQSLRLDPSLKCPVGERPVRTLGHEIHIGPVVQRRVASELWSPS